MKCCRATSLIYFFGNFSSIFFALFFWKHTKFAPKVMCLILLFWPTMSEVDVDDMAAKAEPSRQEPILFFALLQRVWQNWVWHESVYKGEIWHRISLCGKSPSRWCSLTLAGCLRRSNSGCEHRLFVMCFSSRGSDVWNKLCSERSGAAANAKSKRNLKKTMSGQSWWLCRKKAFCCWGLEDCIGCDFYGNIEELFIFMLISCLLYLVKRNSKLAATVIWIYFQFTNISFNCFTVF